MNGRNIRTEARLKISEPVFPENMPWVGILEKLFSVWFHSIQCMRVIPACKFFRTERCKENHVEGIYLSLTKSRERLLRLVSRQSSVKLNRSTIQRSLEKRAQNFGLQAGYIQRGQFGISGKFLVNQLFCSFQQRCYHEQKIQNTCGKGRTLNLLGGPWPFRETWGDTVFSSVKYLTPYHPMLVLWTGSDAVNVKSAG